MARPHFTNVQTRRDFDRLSRRQQDAFIRAQGVAKLMRERNIPFAPANRLYKEKHGTGVDRGTMHRFFGRYMRRTPKGLAIRGNDRTYRSLPVLPVGAFQPENHRVDFRNASRLGHYWNDISDAFTFGNWRRISNFQHERIHTLDGQTFQLETDPTKLTQLKDAGQLDNLIFESGKGLKG